MSKAWAKKFYASRGWEKVRKIALIRDHYLCRRCGEAAHIVHHIIYLTPENIKNVLITLNLENLESICHECHNLEHEVNTVKSTTGDYRFTEDGDVIEIKRPETLRD